MHLICSDNMADIGSNLPQISKTEEVFSLIHSRNLIMIIMSDCIDNFNQRAVLNSQISKWASLNVETPHGSTLGPYM